METQPATQTDAWPRIPYPDWRDTLDTLHMCLQVVGKVRLAQAPFEPEWANVPLYATARGLTTSPIPSERGAFDLDVDLVDHAVVARTSDGRAAAVPLTARPVASFYHDLLGMLHELDIDVDMWPVPVEVPNPVPFADDTVHHSYDREPVDRFRRALSHVDLLMKEHRAGFRGRTTPVQFFWGSFDLAMTRFSGRPATPPPDADVIMRFAHDAEQIAAGFWPGDERFPEPAFYSYAYPNPDGLEDASVAPAAAAWNDDLGEFVLRYEDVRASPSPDEDLLTFLASTYDAAASLMGWDANLVGRDR